MSEPIEGKITSLQQLQNSLAIKCYGISKADAHKQGICIDCKQPIAGLITTTTEANEYRISGLCTLCFDKIFY